MTDPSTPQTPKARRNKGREPQTIDLSATDVSDEAAAMPEPDAGEAASEPPVAESASSSETKPAGKSSSGVMMLTGLACGLLGGIAGAALVLALYKPAPAIPEAFEARMAAIEAGRKEPLPEDPALTRRLADMEAGQEAVRNTLKATVAKMDALAQAALATNQESASAVPEIERRLGALQEAQGNLETAQRALSMLPGKVEALERQTAASARQAVDPLPAVRYALVARLDQIVASGKPFGNVLDAVLKTGVSESDVSALAPFTVTGAPTAAQLKAEFKAPADAMIAEDRSQSGETVTDKLTRMGKSILRIRPREGGQGSDLASRIVRIEAALDRGAFADAAQGWNALPDNARQLSTAWGKRIADRARASAALAALNDKAIAALEGSVR